MARISILGMYEYNPNIFDNFNVPEGLNRDAVINNILIININKVIYDKLTNMPIDFVVDNIEITKTKSDSGLKSDKNFFLAQTYLIRI